MKRLVWVSLLLAFGALLSLLLAACGAPSQQSFPGKVYASGDYRFSVVVPKGWADNEWRDPTPPAGTSGAPIPLTVIVTRAGSTQANNSLVSNLSIAILDLRHPSAVNADLLKVVTTRASNPAYHAVMLAGRTAYAAQPVLQDIYGSQQKATHTDYYLLTTSFEYHIGTDVLAGDNADDAIKSMLASFTLTP